MSYTMAGRRVLITGASSGVGAALARMLAARGTTVGLIARRRDRLEEVLADCRKTSPQSVMWVADLCDTAGAARLALQAWQAMGGIDVLINNAAIPKRREVSALRPTEVEQVMGVNFFAPMRMTLALLPRMLARGSGTIVNVSSVGGRLGIIHESAYCASKFALCGWSESIAVDLAGSGVSVKLIQPGPVDTEIWDRPDNEDPLYRGPKVPADLVAEGIIAAIGSDRFEHYLPEMMALKDIVDAKNADLDTFLTAAAAMTWQ
ncbi:SDR family NAD(P)-dependent oxidoreductase [Mycobacterium marinum]|nr:SDR family NAD(P)-dependent oxidoreductase [Mycobacterium marinum]MDC8973512.1 SDR family NAD(P)-dependent oxidoreductase [Mycobacterium marinum]MDC8981197.1 SDR family NAD(P)-dependent oxidoreductase [Mycobacterium marinum]MDC8994195.1 SDR family NAD(P)-dependent oxidoreductase [Mycobacterium marinum]MDC8999803.1 SDR family NAD(P)-dependent oxidoreductase [Mycobacterium marinum]MDC9010676.1 SDR family NAD(P)-dependent oxidoreductase [Mycobacterium marinum]